MENPSISNPSFSSINIKDVISSKIQQSKAILTSVMFATEFIPAEMALDSHTIYHALWAVDDYLADIELLFNQLS